MTDFEINKRLAELLGFENINPNPAKNIHGEEVRGGNVVAFHDYDGLSGSSLRWYYKDYCNSWADMGGVIENLGIGINKAEDLWEAHDGYIDQGDMVIAKTYEMDTNPLRAAALVAIKILEDSL